MFPGQAEAGAAAGRGGHVGKRQGPGRMVVTAVSNGGVEERRHEFRLREREGSYIRETEPGGRGVPQEDSEPSQKVVGRGGHLRGRRRVEGSGAAEGAGVGGATSGGDQGEQKRRGEDGRGVSGAGARRHEEKPIRAERRRATGTTEKAIGAVPTEDEQVGGGLGRSERQQPVQNEREEFLKPFENKTAQHEAAQLPERKGRGQVAGGTRRETTEDVHARERIQSTKHYFYSSYVQGQAILEAAQSKANEFLLNRRGAFSVRPPRRTQARRRRRRRRWERRRPLLCYVEFPVIRVTKVF